MKAPVAFDLDNTLFDTGRFRDDLFLILEQEGISREAIHNSYKESVESNNGNYSATLHANKLIEQYGVDAVFLHKIFLHFFSQDFSKYFLHSPQELKDTMGDREIFLITRGDLEMQTIKITQSRLNQLFAPEHIIIAPDKGSHDCWRLLNEQGGYYINDNWQETQDLMTKYNNIRFILYVRKDYQRFYTLEEVTIPTFRTLDELKSLVL